MKYALNRLWDGFKNEYQMPLLHVLRTLTRAPQSLYSHQATTIMVRSQA